MLLPREKGKSWKKCKLPIQRQTGQTQKVKWWVSNSIGHQVVVAIWLTRPWLSPPHHSNITSICRVCNNKSSMHLTFKALTILIFQWAISNHNFIKALRIFNSTCKNPKLYLTSNSNNSKWTPLLQRLQVVWLLQHLPSTRNLNAFTLPLIIVLCIKLQTSKESKVLLVWFIPHNSNHICMLHSSILQLTIKCMQPSKTNNLNLPRDPHNQFSTGPFMPQWMLINRECTKANGWLKITSQYITIWWCRMLP